MKWSGGMRLLADIWEELKPNLAANERERVAICETLIARFEEEDVEDHEPLYEYPEMVKAMRNLHPEWDWEEEEEEEDEDTEDEEY